MSGYVIQLPDIDELQERLRDSEWVQYYKKADLMNGPIESMDYLLEFLQKT